MRYLLAAIFVFVLGMPTAFALPAVGRTFVSASKAGPIMQIAKRSRPRAQRHGGGNSGIHPLVGSGDY